VVKEFLADAQAEGEYLLWCKNGTDRYAITTKLDLPKAIEGWEAVEAPPAAVAEFATTILSRALRKNPCVPAEGDPKATVQIGAHKVGVVPNLEYRSWDLDGVPCVMAHLSHGAFGTEDFNIDALFGERGRGSGSAEDLVGMRVRMLPKGITGRIANYVGQLDQATRDHLLSFNLNPQTRSNIENAAETEHVFEIEQWAGQERPLTYISSMVQPLVSQANSEYFRYFGGMGENVVAKIMDKGKLSPMNRSRVADKENERILSFVPDAIRARLGWESGMKRIEEVKAQMFTPPSAVIGGGRKVSMSGSYGSKLGDAMEGDGLFRYNPDLEKVGSINICLMTMALKGNGENQAEDVSELLMKQLERLHKRSGLALTFDVQTVQSLEQGMDHVLATKPHGVCLMWPGDDRMYIDMKDLCLRTSPDGLHHIALQCMNLGDRKWFKDQKGLNFLAKNTLQAFCAKLGHTPFVLDQDVSSKQKNGLVIGMDICRRWNPDTRQATFMANGVSLRTSAGELEQVWS